MDNNIIEILVQNVTPHTAMGFAIAGYWLLALTVLTVLLFILTKATVHAKNSPLKLFTRHWKVFLIIAWIAIALMWAAGLTLIRNM